MIPFIMDLISECAVCTTSEARGAGARCGRAVAIDATNNYKCACARPVADTTFCMKIRTFLWFMARDS